MKKLFLLLSLFIGLKVSAQQTAWTTGVPPGSTSITPSYRQITGDSSTVKLFTGFDATHFYQFYTSAQSNTRFAPITGGGYKPKNDTVNAQGYARNWQLTNLLAGKQNTLVSGTNIKTVNSTSLLGSGDIPFPSALPPSGAAGGSLGGTYPNPTVVTNANLTGDVTSSGNATTLATVNSNVGSVGDATHTAAVTINGKGLITAASNQIIQLPESQVTNLTTDLAARELLSNKETTLTNSSTLYPSGSAVTTALNGYVPTSRTLTINGTTQDLSANRTYTVTATLSNALTFNNTGAGAPSGTVFDGTVAKSISYNTIGAAPSNSIYPNRIKLLWSAAFNGFGNSIMAGSSASSSTNYFINQFALLTNTNFTNYAVAGTGTKELTSIYYSHTPSSGATVPALVEIGTNNLIGSIGQTRQAALKAAFNNLIVNQFTDTVIAASNARITRAGTWAVLTTTNTLPSKSAAYSLGTPYKSSVAGSTMSFTWYGTNLYILTYGASPNHNLGSFKITVDGVDRVTYDENGKGDDWYYTTFGTYDFRTPNAVGVTGLSIGGHSVVITVLQNLEVDIDAIARVLPAGSCAPLQISHILYSTPAGYALGAAHSSTLAADTANAGIDSLVYSWQKMNYPVVASVLERWVNPTTDFAGTDGLHPNNSGHLHIAQSLFDNVIPYGINNSQNQFITYNVSNTNINSAAASGFAAIANGGASYFYRTSNAYAVPNTTYIQPTVNSDLIIFQDNANVMFKHGGNVGIGTMSPLNPLTVLNAGGTTDGIVINNTSNLYSTFASQLNGTFAFNFGAGGTGAIAPLTGKNFINSATGRNLLIVINSGATISAEFKSNGKIKFNSLLASKLVYTSADTSLTNTGSVQNSDLANSSITINGAPISLGGSVTTPSGTVTSVTSANGDFGIATGTTTPVLTFNRSPSYNWIPSAPGTYTLGSSVNYWNQLFVNRQGYATGGYEFVVHNTTSNEIQVANVAVATNNHSIFTPTTGGTVNLINNGTSIINPAGALLALTVNLPSSPVNNDVVEIKFTQSVTTVTYANGTVVDGITSPVGGGYVKLQYDSGTTSWY